MSLTEKVLTALALIFSGILVALVTAVALLPYAAVAVAMFAGLKYLGWL